MMTDHKDLQSISDEELLRRLSEVISQSRRVEADLVAHIAEVDHRRLYAGAACSSMFVYCTRVLNLSEHEAYERITAARASRRFPQLVDMLRDGRLHLCGIRKLAPHLTDENCETLLARASHKTKRQIEELLAELSPKPDVPPTIRKLPEVRVASPPPEPGVVLGPDRVAPRAAPAPQRSPNPPAVKPLAPSRYQVSFTASAELREKLERLQALLQEDLVTVLEAAVTEKLERLEAKRYAQTKSPRKSLAETDTSPNSRHIPAAVRRVVWKRDDGQCTFVDRRGHRCTEQRKLEFHHHEPFALGGSHDPDRISLRCRAHNLYAAERDYGKHVMDRYRKTGDRVAAGFDPVGAGGGI